MIRNIVYGKFSYTAWDKSKVKYFLPVFTLETRRQEAFTRDELVKVS